MACKKPCNNKTALDPAKLRHRIEIQSVTQTADGAGGYTESWATVATVWASIEPANGREKWMAMQTETYMTHVIMCRYQSSITTAKRILFGARKFDIVEVLNIEERNAALKITAIEGSL